MLSCQILTLFRSGRCEELGDDKGWGGGDESLNKGRGNEGQGQGRERRIGKGRVRKEDQRH